ncbi:hypothetical protein L7F22_023953 [Adiantum nelumboides]|nr:hypothetical protein [Adiantum nelumboides]
MAKEDLLKMEENLNITIKDNKKTMDSTINGIITRLSKLEKETEALNKEREAWKKEEEWEMKREKEKEEWKEAQEKWKKAREDMKEQIAILKASVASLSPEEGEINHDTKEALKEELTKTLTAVQATQRAGRAGRTRPGKCYRLYTEAVFENELPAVTVPEIQRSSLSGAVLHLKSLNLEVNVLEFEFLDPPSRASLEDALQQLFIIDAIHEDGSITSLGKRMAALPLEPSLSRALLAAEEAGCLNEALTVAAMLSCESLFIAKSKKSTSHKRDLEFKNLPDGMGLGDHIQLLQIYEEWRQDGFSCEWCEQHGIKTRSMMFARDVRKQLSQIVQWESKGSSRYRQKDPNMVALRRALCIGFSNRLAHRMQRHNGYRTLGAKSQLVQVHPSACSMEVDDDGLLPEWVVYNELVNTGRPYIRNVCAVKGSWCQPALMKLSNLSVSKLGGTQSNAVQNAQKEQQAMVETEPAVVETSSAVNKDVVAAARERFLARKQARI